MWIKSRPDLWVWSGWGDPPDWAAEDSTAEAPWPQPKDTKSLVRGLFRLRPLRSRLAPICQEQARPWMGSWLIDRVDLLGKNGGHVLEWSLRKNPSGSGKAHAATDRVGWAELWEIAGKDPEGVALGAAEVGWPGGRLEDAWLVRAVTWDWQTFRSSLLKHLHPDARVSFLDALKLIDLVFEAGGLRVEGDFLQELGPWVMVESDWPAGEWAPGVVVVPAHRGSVTARAWLLQVLRYVVLVRAD